VKIIVLGGKGFVGSGFVRRAAREGLECLCVDLDNYDSCRGASADLFVNAAGNSKKYLAARAPREDFRISLQGLMNSLEDFGFAHYVYISSSDIYADPSRPASSREDAPLEPDRISNYGFHKYLGELLVRRYLPSWLIVRLGGVLGPGLKKNPVYDLIHDVPLRVHERSRYQYLSPDFLARAVFELARRGRWGNVYNAAGSGTISLEEIRRRLGRTLNYQVSDPPVEHYEIDNGKLTGVLEIPATSQTVEDFLAGEMLVPGSGEGEKR